MMMPVDVLWFILAGIVEQIAGTKSGSDGS